jgi:CheY-like chemotaxis protein
MSAAKKILLIDDDVEFVEANKLLLESHGYDVEVAHEGRSGLDKAQEVRPDLIILDVMMSHSTEGFDVSRELQSCPDLKGTPVLLLTGIRKAMHIPFKFEPDDEWLPVKAILEKPVQPPDLLKEIGKALS